MQCSHQTIGEVYQSRTEGVAALRLRDKRVICDLLLANISIPSGIGHVCSTHRLKLILQIFNSCLRIVWIVDIVYGDLRAASRTLEDEIHKLGQGLLIVLHVSAQPLPRNVFC